MAARRLVRSYSCHQLQPAAPGLLPGCRPIGRFTDEEVFLAPPPGPAGSTGLLSSKRG
jgi:hypothetical protein